MRFLWGNPCWFDSSPGHHSSRSTAQVRPLAGAGWAVLAAAALPLLGGCRATPQPTPGFGPGAPLATAPVVPEVKERVRIEVDFGPLDRPALAGSLRPVSGATTVDVVRALAAVEQRYLCCDENDVWSIGGVGPDPRRDRYWMWYLDGALGPAAAHEFQPQPGQTILWAYRGPRPRAGAPEVGALGTPRRLAALEPSVAAAFYAVGSEASLVAVPADWARPQDAVGDAITLADPAGTRELERLVAAAPEAVVLTKAGGRAHRARLEAAGLPVRVLDLEGEGGRQARIDAFEDLGEMLDRVGAARVAVRLDGP